MILNKVSAFLTTTAALLLCDGGSAMEMARRKLVTLRESVSEKLNSKPERTRRNLSHQLCAEDLESEVAFHMLGVTWYRPSFFQTCAKNVLVDSTNMNMHINSLNEIFKQYHCFYDIAKDPGRSDPISYQPELGNAIYGQGGGAVDIEAGIESILDQVSNEGASMATFWEIETLFNKLYDGHVSLPAMQEDFYSYWLIVVPERYVGNSDFIATPFFYLDQDRNLQLILTYSDYENGATEELPVETINGKSVQDFIVDLANNPSLGLPYQSTGGRVNSFLQKGSVFGGIIVKTKPLDIMPDSFEVTYSDSTAENFVTLLLPFGPWTGWEERQTFDGRIYFGINAVEAETFINQPGAQFDAYRRAISDISTTIGGRKLSPAQREQRELQDSEAEILAYVLDEDVAVFKVQTFIVDLEYLKTSWNDLVNVARGAGQTKLIIDLSSNTGGYVQCAYALLFCMFPNLDVMWFLDQWDINWNLPMTEFLEGMKPVFEAIRVFDPSTIDETRQEELQARIDEFTQFDMEAYKIGAAAMVELCSPNPNNPLQCARVEGLAANITAFIESPNLDTYFVLISDLIGTVADYNPFSVTRVYLDGSDGTTKETLSSLEKGPTTVLRGGVESNITRRFNFWVSEEILKMVMSNMITDLPFDEYIIVSDGTSASAAAIVPFTAAQLYKNRERTGVQTKVRLMGYGGTGKESEMVLSTAPASMENVHLENPIIGDAVLSMLIYSLPYSLSSMNEIEKQASQYSDVVPIPPYFGNTLPKMPVRNFYDISMGAGALPLQFVRIPLDEYIPKIYLAVTISNADDLESLYKDVATYFGAGK